MSPSSTPGSPEDPVARTDTGPHDLDATRPIPPVDRGAAAPRRSSSAPDGSPDTAAPGAAHGTGQDWSWYDDAMQHTRPLPPVTAQQPAPEAPAPRTGPAPVVPAEAHRGGPHAPGAVPAAGPVDPAVRHARQQQEFGGLQPVPGLFGWLSTLSLTWLLLALAVALGAGLSLRLGDGVGGVADDLAAGSPGARSAAAVLGAVELLAFLGGGYVAGRMARFSGARQGVSVWLWSLAARSVATVAGLLGVGTARPAPVGVSAQDLIGDLLAPGLLALAAVLAVDLLGAVLGGLWGTRYHRRVDRRGDAGG